MARGPGPTPGQRPPPERHELQMTQAPLEEYVLPVALRVHPTICASNEPTRRRRCAAGTAVMVKMTTWQIWNHKSPAGDTRTAQASVRPELSSELTSAPRKRMRHLNAILQGQQRASILAAHQRAPSQTIRRASSTHGPRRFKRHNTNQRYPVAKINLLGLG